MTEKNHNEGQGVPDWEIPLPDEFRYVPPHLHDQTLAQIKISGVPKEQIDAVPVRKLPTGLKLWWEQFVEKYKFSSQSHLQLTASAHGMTVLLHDDRIKECGRLYRDVSQRAREESDREAALVLEKKSEKFSYEKETQYTGTLKGLKEIEGIMGKLGSTINLDQGKTYTYCIMVSMMTVEDVKFNKMFEGEIKRFWNHIADWTNILKGRAEKKDQAENG